MLCAFVQSLQKYQTLRSISVSVGSRFGINVDINRVSLKFLYIRLLSLCLEDY